MKIKEVNNWSTPARDKSIKNAIQALKENGIEAVVVKNGKEAVKKVLEMVPEGSEVMTMSSVTVDSLGISKIINESGKYDSVKVKLGKMDREKDARQMRKIGASPDYAIGSVHAVTEDGKVIVASNTGSQLPAYTYGSEKVIWVVGSQKLVKNLAEGVKRLYGYTLPLEDARMKKAYGMGSFVSKLLIINKEKTIGRLNMIIVKENIGF